MSASRQITEREVRAKRAPGHKLHEALRGRGGGTLVVRWGAADSRWYYFRFTDSQRRQREIPIRVATLAEARDQAQALVDRAREARAEGSDLRAILDQEVAARRREEQARLDAAAAAARTAEHGTLRAMMAAYVAFLERAGKPSAADVERLFRRYVCTSPDGLADRPASAITADEVAALLRGIFEKGHARTAAMVRSYLSAAFALAMRARRDASAPAALITLGVTTNPAAATERIPGAINARDRVLTEGELGLYAAALDAMAVSPARDALRLSLLLGGQRMKQLLRCAQGDVDLAAGTITLRDGKGRRQVPRLHVLPLAATARAIVEARIEGASDAPLFSADGRRATRIETCEAVAGEIFAAMPGDERLIRDKALGAGPVQLRDVRRTCETMLAARGVSSDIRAQILSHGLAGVQLKHYNRHAYMDEKARVLADWEAHVAALVRQRKADANDPAPASSAPRPTAAVVAMAPARARRGRS